MKLPRIITVFLKSFYADEEYFNWQEKNWSKFLLYIIQKGKEIFNFHQYGQNYIISLQLF